MSASQLCNARSPQRPAGGAADIPVEARGPARDGTAGAFCGCWAFRGDRVARSARRAGIARRARPAARRRDGGFTLLELILAMGMIAMLSLSLYTAMRIAIQARRTAHAAVEPTRSAAIASDILRLDIENAQPPTGLLKGPFMATHQSGPNGGDADTVQFYTLGRDEQAADDDPLAEGIRRVELAIRTDVNPPALVRRVTRDLISTTEQQPEEEVLVRDVRSFSLRYFDGTTWQEEWDSTALGDVLPLAVMVTLELNDPLAQDASAVSPRRAQRIITLSCGKLSDSATIGGL
ncbi:MAG TPA: GspJ family type II secretion system protein [Tepidisphaeraceae bacterium]|nr:GspJ family type II secretion system protein [Tepidisphaeraceae bacterium]